MQCKQNTALEEVPGGSSCLPALRRRPGCCRFRVTRRQSERNRPRRSTSWGRPHRGGSVLGAVNEGDRCQMVTGPHRVQLCGCLAAKAHVVDPTDHDGRRMIILDTGRELSSTKGPTDCCRKTSCTNSYQYYYTVYYSNVVCGQFEVVPVSLFTSTSVPFKGAVRSWCINI